MSFDEIEFPDPGEVPVLDWIDVNQIGVEECYQRPLDMARVESIVRSFSWRSFGALVIVPQADGTYHATDGQHRLEAAKLHPMITHIPACIVKADDMRDEAGIFVDINKNRKNVSALELFFAQLTAGDDDAVTIQQVCGRAGIRIPKYPGDYKPGDCVSIAAIQATIGRRGAMRARQYLEVLVQAGFAPITASQIKAVEHLMTDEEFADWITIEDLGETIKGLGSKPAEVEAKRFAATHCVPVWQGLANIWFQKTRKRRTPVGRAA